LRRMVLGPDNAGLQGVDYAYTLQGWLKGVNSANGSHIADMGQDGSSSSTVSWDNYAYSLGYYPGDFAPIGGMADSAFALQYVQAIGDITGQSLYNGNISNMTVAIPLTTEQVSRLSTTTVGYTYHYDQLNRLKKMRYYSGITGTAWSRSNISLNYQENISYDGNGNILTYGRNGGDTTAQTIDSLTYYYNYAGGKLVNNKLNYIHDAIDSSGYDLDLRNQTSTTNYQYDAIGNLLSDAQSNITNTDWTVYNKPDTIFKSAGNITYAYNTANQRISKTYGGVTTYYVRDAQGNVLGVYDNALGNTNWREQHLYGSSRLGMWTPNLNLANDSVMARWDTLLYRQYELTNHLGNVLETITDLNVISPPEESLTVPGQSHDYYPGGMLMPGRQFTATGDSLYRYGFNSKENDNEVYGLGNLQDYGARMYIPQIVRFPSVDPVSAKYPDLSSYQFASNNPIANLDVDGKEGKNFFRMAKAAYWRWPSP